MDRLIVIDDEVELGRFVGRVAESVGYEVKVTSRVQDFKTAVGSWNPSAIIMDLAMPEADGLELLRWLASENSRARIIIMSGYDTRVVEAAKRIGVLRSLGQNRLEIHLSILDPAGIQAFDRQFRGASSMTLTFPDGNEPPWSLSLAGSTAISATFGRCVRDLTQQVQAAQSQGNWPPGNARSRSRPAFCFVAHNGRRARCRE